MTMNHLKTFALAFGLAAAFGCSSSEPQEKVLLRGGATKGLQYTQDRTEKVKGHLDIQFDNDLNRQPLVKDEHRVFEDEVLEVQDGRVMSLRRKNLAWDLKRQAFGDASMVVVPRTTVGKTIVLHRTELGTEYENVEGLPMEELKANLLGALEAIVSPPADPVAVGSSWELDGDRIVEMFGSEASSRPLKVREVSGIGRLDWIDANRVAKISLKLNAKGSFRALLDVDVTLAMTATLQFDLNAGRPVAFDAHADGKIAGEVDRKGKMAYYNGEFAWDAAATNKYR